MAQLFKPQHNDIFRGLLMAGIILFIVLLIVLDLLQPTSYMTKVGVDISQPIPFRHSHHVGGLGIDCRFCHTSVENSPFAGMPTTEICMKCHREIWKNSPVLAPVRESFRTGRPIIWSRVHNLPDYVYFDHSIHVQKGVACITCHGPVDQMPLMHKQNTLYMSWCLDCHHHPGNYIGPKDKVFLMDRTAQSSVHPFKNSYSPYRIKQITNCSVCHH